MIKILRFATLMFRGGITATVSLYLTNVIIEFAQLIVSRDLLSNRNSDQLV